jgi:hypothetical protein
MALAGPGDQPGDVLAELDGTWDYLSPGERDAEEAGAQAVRDDSAGEVTRLRERLADAEHQRDRWISEAASQERRAGDLLGLLGEILPDLKAKDVGRRVLGQMPGGWTAEEYQVQLWRERAEQAGLGRPS